MGKFFFSRNGFRMSVEVDGLSVAKEARRISDQASDIRPVFKQLANEMRKSFRLNFAEGGRPDRWRPLRPNTVAAKSAIGLEAGFPYASMLGRKRIRRLEQRGKRSLTNILIARGDLRDSYSQRSNKDHVERISKDRVEVGSKHWLANIHEHGTEPYTIVPKKARGLRFMTTTGPAFAGKVNHPGLPARPVALVQTEDLDAFDTMMEEHLK